MPALPRLIHARGLADRTDLGLDALGRARPLATALGVAAAERRREAEAASGPPEPPEPPLAAADAVDHLTARRLYASAALTGMLAGTEPGARYLKPAILAPLALGYADALIAAERQNGDPA